MEYENYDLMNQAPDVHLGPSQTCKMEHFC